MIDLITRMIFKHEGDVDGVPIGPATFTDSEPDEPQPYDPDREVKWVTLTEAQSLADAAGVPLVEV